MTTGAPVLSGADRQTDLALRTTFRREFTPTWLSLACLLQRHRPPELTRPFRYLLVGCAHGNTALTVAATHPASCVWAIDEHAELVEDVACLRDEAELPNLHVHQCLPADLADVSINGDPFPDQFDLIVIDDMLDSVSEQDRGHLIEMVRRRLRPGGLACVSYQVLSGWAELLPLQNFMRLVAERTVGGPADAFRTAVELLTQLRSGGALYLSSSPRVSQWLDHLVDVGPDDIAEKFLAGRFHPLSHAEVTKQFAVAGCSFIGNARLTDDIDHEISPSLRTKITSVEYRPLRETLTDLAVGRTRRLDLFRRGEAPIDADATIARLMAIDFVRLTPDEPADTTLTQLPTEGARSDSVETVVRSMVQDGIVHPCVVGGPQPDAVEACRRLNAAWLKLSPLQRPLRAAASVGTAIGG